MPQSAVNSDLEFVGMHLKSNHLFIILPCLLVLFKLQSFYSFLLSFFPGVNVPVILKSLYYFAVYELYPYSLPVALEGCLKRGEISINYLLKGGSLLATER